MVKRDSIFVRPSRPGMIVRDPVSLKQLDENGEEKPRTTYWLRRVRCGDCIEVGTAVAKPKPIVPPQPMPEPERVTPAAEAAALPKKKKATEKKGEDQ